MQRNRNNERDNWPREVVINTAAILAMMNETPGSIAKARQEQKKIWDLEAQAQIKKTVATVPSNQLNHGSEPKKSTMNHQHKKNNR